MYHSISDSDDYRELPSACRPIGYRTGVEVFEDHLSVLKKAGWSTILLEELVSRQELPEKAVVITFDDGYADNYHTALPRLQENGFSAIFFISASSFGKPGMMGIEEVSELLRSGMEIGSHGMRHDLLSGLGESELDWELKESKQRLSEQFSIATDFSPSPGDIFLHLYPGWPAAPATGDSVHLLPVSTPNEPIPSLSAGSRFDRTGAERSWRRSWPGKGNYTGDCSWLRISGLF